MFFFKSYWRLTGHSPELTFKLFEGDAVNEEDGGPVVEFCWVVVGVLVGRWEELVEEEENWFGGATLFCNKGLDIFVSEKNFFESWKRMPPAPGASATTKQHHNKTTVEKWNYGIQFQLIPFYNLFFSPLLWRKTVEENTHVFEGDYSVWAS